jgi:hypothetical protein
MSQSTALQTVELHESTGPGVQLHEHRHLIHKARGQNEKQLRGTESFQVADRGRSRTEVAHSCRTPRRKKLDWDRNSDIFALARNDARLKQASSVLA